MGIFEASPEGFRQLQLGRIAEHLVRELLQNVFDEAATMCAVEIHHTPKKGVRVTVTDNVQGGVRDEKLIFTIFLSDKQDSPTKRGRMGRGLKELVSVSDRTIVATQGRKAIVFARDQDGTWTRSESSAFEVPDIGTKVEAQVRNWGAKEAASIIAYLKRMRPPAGLHMTVNGETVHRKTPLESHRVKLQAPFFMVEDGERKESTQTLETTLELFAEETSWVYEMGIPIEPIEYPLSVDVGQRVPLRERRDTLTTPFARQLFARLLDARVHILPVEALKDNHVLRASEEYWSLSKDSKAAIIAAWTGNVPYADSPLKMSQATGQHISCINLRTLPEGIRDVVRRDGVSVDTVLAERKSTACPVVARKDLTPQELRLKQVFEWLAAGVKRPCTVQFRDGLCGAQADFERATSTLTVYRENVGKTFFENPLGARPLSLLIHELAHWTIKEEEHGMAFHADGEDVGGAIASFLCYHAVAAINMAGG